MKIKERILIIWKDSVLSKVIAQGIIVLIPFIFVFIKNYYRDLTFVQILKNTIHYKIEFWIILIAIAVILILILIIQALNSKPKIQVLNEEQLKHDKELFQLIKEKLQDQNSIEFIRELDWGNPFLWSNLTDFHFVIDKYKNPNVTFIDVDIENLRSGLFDKIYKFRSFLSLKSFPSRIVGDDYCRVPIDWRDEPSSSIKYWEIIDKLNSMSDEICLDYDEFIKKGKIKFGI